MFSINVLITHSSTVNWQDASYTKCLEMILTNYANFNLCEKANSSPARRDPDDSL